MTPAAEFTPKRYSRHPLLLVQSSIIFPGTFAHEYLSPSLRIASSDFDANQANFETTVRDE